MIQPGWTRTEPVTRVVEIEEELVSLVTYLRSAETGGVGVKAEWVGRKGAHEPFQVYRTTNNPSFYE